MGCCCSASTGGKAPEDIPAVGATTDRVWKKNPSLSSSTDRPQFRENAHSSQRRTSLAVDDMFASIRGASPSHAERNEWDGGSIELTEVKQEEEGTPTGAPPPPLAGWLMKKGQGKGTFGRRNWKKRWFKLEVSATFSIKYLTAQACTTLTLSSLSLYLSISLSL